MMKYLFFLFVFFLSLGFFPKNLPAFLDPVHELELANGMKFLLLPRKGAPVFSAYIRVKVGGLDEPQGQTGIAHLLEHMAFKGTPQIGSKNFAKEVKVLAKLEKTFQSFKKATGKKKQKLAKQLKNLQAQAQAYVVKEAFSRIYQEKGGVGLNATTSQDLTSYFVSLPSHYLELWAYLESERLKNPVFREFYEEKEVVFEERRMRVEDSPLGALYGALMEEAFGLQGYGRPTIGYVEDLKNLSAGDLEKFYQDYYGASNTVVALVGDFSLSKTKALLKKYFSSVAPGKKARQSNPKPQTKGHLVEIRKKASPLWFFAFYRPGIKHPDDYALDLVATVLCEGASSPLYRTLVLEKKLLESIDCSASSPGVRGETLFLIMARPFDQDSFALVKQEVFKIINRFKRQGFSEADLAMARKKLNSTFYYDLQSNQSLARALSYYEVLGLGWNYLSSYAKKIQSLDQKEISQVFKKYFKVSNGVEARLRPL